MNEGASTVKAGTYRNPETGSSRRGRLTGRWLPLSAGTTEGGREGGLAWTRRISPLHQGLFRMIGGEGLACHTGVAAFASASSSVLRPLTLTMCSRRMAPQFHGGGRVILHAVPGRNDFFTGAPVQVG